MLPIGAQSKKSLVHDCQEMYQNAKSIFADEEVHHLGLLFSLVLINALGDPSQVSTIATASSPSFSWALANPLDLRGSDYFKHGLG